MSYPAEESWASNPIVKPPSLTLHSLTGPEDDGDNNDTIGGESSQWQSSAQGSQQHSQQQFQPSLHASNTSSLQGSLTIMNFMDDCNNASYSSQPRQGRRGSLVLKNLKNMLRTNKGAEGVAAAPAAPGEEALPTELDPPVPERPPLSPRKKTLKQRFSILRPSIATNNRFNPDEPYPHLDPTTTGLDLTESGSGTAAGTTDMGASSSFPTENATTMMSSLESATTTTTTATKAELPPLSPLKKKNKLIRPFMSLPKRASSLPVRASQQKEKAARRQARQDIMGRIGGALGESATLNRSGTSAGDSGAFLIEGIDATSGDVFASTTSSATNNNHNSNTTNDSLWLDASERTAGNSAGGGRFARVRAMVQRTSIFQPRTKTDAAPLIMLDDPSSEFSMERQQDAGDDDSSHRDDLEEDDDHNNDDNGPPPELPRPSLEVQQSNHQVPLHYPNNNDRGMIEDGAEETKTMNEPPTAPASDKVENSISERRRARRQNQQHQQSNTSASSTSQSHSDNRNSPRRSRVGGGGSGGRRQSRSHPDEGNNKSESANPGSQSPCSLHRRSRVRTSRSNPSHDRTSEHQRTTVSSTEPQTPSRRRMRKVVDSKSNNSREEGMDRAKEDDGVVDESPVGDPQTPNRRRTRRHDHNNNVNSTNDSTTYKSKSTDERENDHHHDGKMSAMGDVESPSARRTGHDPLTVRRRLKQQGSSGSRTNHPEDDPNSSNTKSPSKYGARDSTSNRSESPTKSRSLSPQKPSGGEQQQTGSDRSSKPASRERSKESSSRSRHRRKSPTKQPGMTRQTSSGSQDRRDKRSTSPKKDDRRSKSPLQKDKGQEETHSRNETIRSNSPSKSPTRDNQESKRAPEKSSSNGTSGRSRQRSGSPGRSHGRSPTNVKETEGSRVKGGHRRGRNRDEPTRPQRHSSEKERRTTTNEGGSDRRRKTKSLSPNPSEEDRVSRRGDEQQRPRQDHSPIPDESAPRPPTKIHSYDPSHTRQGGGGSDVRSIVSSAVDNHKSRSDPSRGRRLHNHHHPDDRSVASAGVHRHGGRYHHSQVETTVSELGANMAKLDSLQRL